MGGMNPMGMNPMMMMGGMNPMGADGMNMFGQVGEAMADFCCCCTRILAADIPFTRCRECLAWVWAWACPT